MVGFCLLRNKHAMPAEFVSLVQLIDSGSGIRNMIILRENVSSNVLDKHCGPIYGIPFCNERLSAI